jgi:hypothetical protein
MSKVSVARDCNLYKTYCFRWIQFSLNICLLIRVFFVNSFISQINQSLNKWKKLSKSMIKYNPATLKEKFPL